MPRRTPEPLQQYRGTTAQHAAYTGPVGEITVDTTKKTAVVHDGVTAGGHPLAKESTTITASNGVEISAGGTLGQNTTVSGVSASTSVPGVVQLNNATDSTAQNQAATPKAVSDALAEAKTYADSVAGDAPNVTNATGVLPVAHGGTGSSTQNFVDLSSAQTVAGEKTLTANPIIKSATSSIILQQTDITKGTNPSASQFVAIRMVDSAGTAAVNRTGAIENRIEDSGLVSTWLRAYQFVNGSTVNAALGVHCSADGNTKYAVAPTPAAGDNSAKIATTEWFKNEKATTTNFGVGRSATAAEAEAGATSGTGPAWVTPEQLRTKTDGIVTLLGSRTTTGAWTLAGLTIGKPLYVLASNDPAFNAEFPYCQIHVESGSLDGKAFPGYAPLSFTIGATTGGSTNIFCVIPNSTTVVLTVENVSQTNKITLRAYQ